MSSVVIIEAVATKAAVIFLAISINVHSFYSLALTISLSVWLSDLLSFSLSFFLRYG